MTELSVPDSPGFVPPRVIDVSEFPESAMDWRDPVWWGNTLLMFIETTTVVLTLASYFYIRRNFQTFPPPKTDVVPPIYDTRPVLTWGTINLVLIVLACVPMYWTDMQARKKKRGGVIVGLIVMLLVAAVTIWLRFKEFPATRFWWNDNAYASCIWTILGLHLTYLLAAALEFLVMGVWIVTHEFDDAHALDVTLAGGYWYWIAATWLLCYLVVYFGPRWT